MNKIILSKSDFKIAQSCPTKLYYKKMGYPNSKEEDDYLQMLADGGYMVGKMAQLLFPNGVDLSSEKNTESALEKTLALLEKENAIIFEPAIYSNQKLARVDILIKNGNTIKLVEVKSKSFDSREYATAKGNNKKYFELSGWNEYIEDVAFQKLILQENHPEKKIEAYLFLPDKAKTTPIEGLINWFKINKITISETSKFRDVEVAFVGNIDQLKEGHILELVNIDDYVDDKIEIVSVNAKKYIESLNKNEKVDTPLQTFCSKCEYTTSNKKFTKTGLQECWGELAEVKPHIFELSQLGNFNRKKEKPIDTLINQKKVSLYDVPLELVKDKYNNRAYYQLTKDNEFLLEGFDRIANQLEYPIHFIDFETSQMALPYHAGMRPYEKIIFQWSCHTVDKKGEKPKHYEWINTDNQFPNFEFAKSLKETIGDCGSIMIWSLYENTMLKDILNSFEHHNYENEELRKWLLNTIIVDKDTPSRIIDLNELTLKNYFHPLMNGKTSLKKTLPAVLSEIKSYRIKELLNDIGLYKENDFGICNPYELLPKIIIGEKILDVNNGTDAMLAYQEIMYGCGAEDKESKETIKKSLLEYCKLDTLAMVLIWEHWSDLAYRNMKQNT